MEITKNYSNINSIEHNFAQEAAQAGNMVFALSLEGLEKATNDRRGENSSSIG